MKKFLSLLSLFLFTPCIIAQSTTVSATVVDSDSTTWTNGKWSISFVPSQSFPNPSSYTCNGSALITSFKGSINGSGVLSQAICTGSYTSPSGGSWNITVCPNASAPCGELNFTTVGASIDISTALSAVITAPRFIAVSGTYGYNDGEATLSLKPGNTYWNVTSGVQRCYTGSAWGACSASGGGSIFPSNMRLLIEGASRTQ